MLWAMDFNERLRRLREHQGLTRYRLAKLSGISKDGIKKLEQPGSDPKLSTLYKLARALHVNIDAFVTSLGSREKHGRNHDKRRAKRRKSSDERRGA
jgi:transcriptional regulator with XRE-family HTH domain